MGKGGVVRDPDDRREALRAVAGAAADAGARRARLRLLRVCPGPKGNRETFIHAPPGGEALADVEAAIAEVEP